MHGSTAHLGLDRLYRGVLTIPRQLHDLWQRYSARCNRSIRKRCSRCFISFGMRSRPTSPVSSRVLR